MNAQQIMALADDMAANHAWYLNCPKGEAQEAAMETNQARAALEAAVTAQEKQIEQLAKQYEALKIAYGLMQGSSK